MNSNEVIDKLCEKLGIAASRISDIVPSIVKMKITDSIGCVIIFLILSVLLFCIHCKMEKPEDLFKTDWKSITGIASLLFFIIAMFFAVDTVEWIVAPEAKAIEYVVNMIQRS